MLKRLTTALISLLLAATAFGQTYPSPTYQGITIRGITGLQLDNGTSAASAYAGTSCTNQFPRSLNGSGAATCSSVGLTSDVSGVLPVASGGTNSATASGAALDNITGFSSTGFLTRTGAGAYAFQSLTNGITYGNLAQASANTLLGNATGSTANVTAITVTGCNGAAQALQWTNGSGFQCNSSIATSGSNSNITSLSGLTTPLSVSQGGTGLATIAAHGVMVGEGTGNVATAAPVSAGYVLTDNGPGFDPTFQALSVNSGRLLVVTAFTSSGTWTPNASTTHWYAEGCGGGGGGGGAAAASSGQIATGGGGASGSFFKHYGASNPGAQTITIGAAGTAGTAGNNAGGSGGTTSIGSIISAPGGGGGPGLASLTPPYFQNPGSPGSVSTGANLLNSAGSSGTPAVGSNTGDEYSGSGGSSPFGSGGAPTTIATSSAGNPGTGQCSGGSGGASTNGGAAEAGGAGTKGIVIIWEFS